MKHQLMVRFWYPGSFFAESNTEEVGHRDPDKVAVPEGAFAFQFFDRVTQTSTLEDGREIEHVETENEGPRYYPGGQVLTLETIPDTDKNRILRANMEGNGWDRVVRTRRGNVQPLEDGIVL